jgi:ParB family chromosome partitioning protein
METKRKALGKGLEQLFNNEAIDIETFEKNIVASSSKKDIVEINLSELRSNPYQPRKVFDEAKLQELASSIKEHGVFQPIIVKKSIKGYEIVAGERRVKASELAGKETIPAIIKDFTDEEMMEIALLENIQRENLNAIEEAEAYKKLIIALEITQDELARRVGKSRSYVTNMIGILRLPKEVQSLVLHGDISMGHAKTLSKLEDNEKILLLAQKIVDESMNVRKLEEEVNSEEYKRQVPIKKNKKENNKYSFIQDIMREKIGTMVKVNDKNIIIPFDSEKDLERILEILKIDVDVD